jgi:hypothetical protein
VAAPDPAVFRRFRRRRLMRRLAAFGVTAALTLALIEVLLRATDPFGVAYFHDLAANFYDVALPDPRGYVVAPGEYRASHWSFTILGDHTRAVPDTPADAERTMVFIGDSVAFGYGVEDEETFVNLVARAFPDWRVVNDSYPGWNIQNLEAAWKMHSDADLIFVLTITNDLHEPMRTADMRGWRPTYIQLYATMVWWLLRGFPVPSAEAVAALEPGWLESITRIATDPRVTLLVIDTTGGYDDRVMDLFPDKTHRLENFSSLVSTVDSHPDPSSHAFLAEQIVPIVREKVAALE